MKRGILLLIVGVMLTAAVFAQTATVTQFSGKVEYRIGNGAWQAVSERLQIPISATISTGFGASAVLQVATAKVEVGQLTRLTVEELADNGTTVSTGLFVPVGSVRASVARTPTRSNDFTVRTAQSTAAVRGTEFETNGWQLSVSEGIVQFASLLGQTRNVAATQISVVTNSGPSDPQDELNNRANVGDDQGPGEFEGSATSGYITVRWK